MRTERKYDLESADPLRLSEFVVPRSLPLTLWNREEQINQLKLPYAELNAMETKC